MRKLAAICFLAGLITVSACGRTESPIRNVDDMTNISSGQEIDHTTQKNEDENIPSAFGTVSKEEAKTVMCQYLKSINTCHFTITAKEKFHVTPASDSENEQEPSQQMEEYDVENNSITEFTNNGTWMHVKNTSDHHVAEMETDDKTEFFIQKKDGEYVFHGYEEDDGSCSYTPLSSLNEMESADILQSLTEDDVEVTGGKTLLGEDGYLSGYEINLTIPYKTYYKFYNFGTTLVAPELPETEQSKKAAVSMEFTTSGQLSSIHMERLDNDSYTNESGTTIKMMKETIDISFDTTIPDITLPDAVKTCLKDHS